ncbi:MAG: hypothetical protein WAO58_10425 [Fimbriimonadaceae bacterium]
MHTVIRIYRETTGLARILAERAPEVRAVLDRVPGFISYTLIQTSDGAASVTTCRDRLGTEESNRLASEWLGKNLPQFSLLPPDVVQGEAILSLSGSAAGV